MRVKFYKGPLHGKSYDINPLDLRNGSILYSYIDKSANVYADMSRPTSPFDVIRFNNVEYRVKMMAGSLNGQSFSGPAVHPDGSLFLEYVEPRKKK